MKLEIFEIIRSAINNLFLLKFYISDEKKNQSHKEGQFLAMVKKPMGNATKLWTYTH